MGRLNQGRNGHAAIEVQGQFLVVGGGGDYGSTVTEKCVFNNKRVRCNAQLPYLHAYETYPELFAVPNDFCHT